MLALLAVFLDLSSSSFVIWELVPCDRVHLPHFEHQNLFLLSKNLISLSPDLGGTLSAEFPFFELFHLPLDLGGFFCEEN